MWRLLHLEKLPRSLATVSLLFVIIAATALASFVVVSGLLDDRAVAPAPTILVEPTPEPGEWAVLVSSAKPSTVAVQTFQNGRVVRSGTGTVVSADGLIVTVVDVVPFGYRTVQVVTSAQVLRGAVVARDTKTNLALVKVEGQDMPVASFVRAHPPVGTPLALVGSIVDFSAYQPLFAHGWLSHDFVTYSVLDAAFQEALGGVRVLTQGGQQAGIGFLRGTQVRMVRSAQVQAFIDGYLDTLVPMQ